MTRRPRITKAERLDKKRKKEREQMAQVNKTPTNGYVLQPTNTNTTPLTLGV